MNIIEQQSVYKYILFIKTNSSKTDGQKYMEGMQKHTGNFEELKYIFERSVSYLKSQSIPICGTADIFKNISYLCFWEIQDCIKKL